MVHAKHAEGLRRPQRLWLDFFFNFSKIFAGEIIVKIPCKIVIECEMAFIGSI